MTDLERCQEERDRAREGYVAAIRDMAHYAIELDEQITEPYRKYLLALAADVASGSRAMLADSRATLRSLARDYRDKGARYLQQLREELASTAHSLQEILDSLRQGDGDHEGCRGKRSHGCGNRRIRRCWLPPMQLKTAWHSSANNIS